MCLLLNCKEFSFKIVFSIFLSVVLRNGTSSALGLGCRGGVWHYQFLCMECVEIQSCDINNIKGAVLV